MEGLLLCTDPATMVFELWTVDAIAPFLHVFLHM